MGQELSLIHISLNYLIKKARQGDTDAFVELMERQKQSMYKVARSYLHREEDIADAMQETVLDCYDCLLYTSFCLVIKAWKKSPKNRMYF